MRKTQLIVLGYAGSQASNFNNLSQYLDENIILSVIEYKGRGTRREEVFYENCIEMEKDIAEQIKKARIKEYPYAILGYSMGVQNVYELFAKKLLEECPIAIFVAAHEPPNVECAAKKISVNNDGTFQEYIKRYGGLDERLLCEPRFAEIYITRIYADFKLLKMYSFNGEYRCFPIKLNVLYCEADTPLETIKDWRLFATNVDFHELGHNHFFYKTDTKKFCDIIKNSIRGGYNSEEY